jgi:hypothetical protein
MLAANSYAPSSPSACSYGPSSRSHGIQATLEIGTLIVVRLFVVEPAQTREPPLLSGVGRHLHHRSVGVPLAGAFFDVLRAVVSFGLGRIILIGDEAP